MPSQIEVPIASLSRDAIEGLVEEYVTREGTDYGAREFSLAEKCSAVMRQLERGEVVVIFDFESESTTLVRRDELRKSQQPQLDDQ